MTDLFSQFALSQAEKALTSNLDTSDAAVQTAQLANDYLIAWGNALFQFERKSPGTKVAGILREERLRIIRLLRDNQWFKKYL